MALREKTGPAAWKPGCGWARRSRPPAQGRGCQAALSSSSCPCPLSRIPGRPSCGVAPSGQFPCPGPPPARSGSQGAPEGHAVLLAAGRRGGQRVPAKQTARWPIREEATVPQGFWVFPRGLRLGTPSDSGWAPQAHSPAAGAPPTEGRQAGQVSMSSGLRGRQKSHPSPSRSAQATCPRTGSRPHYSCPWS